MWDARGAIGALFVGALFVGALLAGCPISSSRPELDDFAAQYAAATCDNATRCGFVWSFELALRSEVTDCASQLTAVSTDFEVPSLREAIATGTVVYHPELAQACLDTLRTQACYERRGGSACDAVYEGRIPDAQPCDLDRQCVSGRCEPSGSACPRGVCRHVPAEGEACDPSGARPRCARDTRCAPTPGGGDACVPQLVQDAPCDVGDLDACIAFLVCVPSAPGSRAGTCGPGRGALGAPCAGGGGCAAGLVCGPRADSIGGGTCRAPRTDGTCQYAQSSPSDCPPGQACSATDAMHDGTCAPYPIAGQPCLDRCTGGARCNPAADGASHVCVTIRRLGEPCTASTDCESERCVDAVCVARPLCSA
jgi:hypothetical protein